MENQNSVAIPTGEGTFKVHSATQAVSDTQAVLANVLGIPLHKVNVVMKRTGGAFGGKFTRSFHCAAAAAVAASKFNLPVHVKNDREIDFAMVCFTPYLFKCTPQIDSTYSLFWHLVSSKFVLKLGGWS